MQYDLNKNYIKNRTDYLYACLDTLDKQRVIIIDELLDLRDELKKRIKDEIPKKDD